jgi:hypothetical protein
MRYRLPFILADDLTLAIPGTVVRLTPRRAFDLAEDLARKATRAAIADEAVKAQRTSQEKRSDVRRRLKR